MAESDPAPNKKNRNQPPQKNIDDFWGAYTTKFPGKVTTVLPQNQHAILKAKQTPRGAIQSEPVKAGYERARKECYATVDKISKECRRVNRRYRDLHFDMEFDLKMGRSDCLETLVGPQGDTPFTPKSVKRVGEIFENPKFYVDGATATDIRQGNDGDCWFLSGLSACVHRRDWIDSICVHRDEAVGVYGFVFHRDGEWTYTVIDDRLYLTAADWDESVHEKWAVTQLNNGGDEDEYKKVFQSGSKALYFAQCASPNETWLPLIEKAYAKAHGDFRSISGGFTGEGIEDLTGGVTTELWTSDIFDKELFWKDLLLVNKDYLFSCATGWSDNFLGGSYMTDRKGVVSRHAYSVMEAIEIEGKRLLKLRNPWGKSEWQGPWSDGSAEWTPEWMARLNHRFGDDGVFWMSFPDLLKKFSEFDRTRLFDDPEWKISQQWTAVDVPWSGEYLTNKFEVEVKQAGRCVIVLSQLDDRYFEGLAGRYYFSLQFRVENKSEEGYIVRSNETYFMTRSCNVELDLEPGTYTVLLKITADRYEDEKSPEHVIRETFKTKREKLLQIGLAYDLAHAKAIPYESAEEIAARKEKQKQEKAEAKAKAKKAKRDEKWADWEKNMREFMRKRREKDRRKRHDEKKQELLKQAKKEAEEAGGNATATEKIDEPPKETAKVEAKSDESTQAEKKVGEKETTPAEPSKAVNKPAEQPTEKPVVTAEAASPVPPPAPEPSVAAQPLDAVAEAEAKFKAIIAQAELALAETRAAAAASRAGASSSTPKQADIPPAIDPKAAETSAQSEASTQSDAIKTPTTSASESKEASEKGADKPEAPGAPEITVTAPQEPSAPAAPEAPGSVVAGAAGSVAGSVSDIESVLSWATSIDSKLDSIDYSSSSDDDSDAESSAAEEEEDADNVPVADDPWNAVCVVGLRVFSKSDVAVRVVKEKKGKKGKEGDAPLDVDDISKPGAAETSVVAQAEVQKPSVDGERPPLEMRESFRGKEARGAVSSMPVRLGGH